MGGICEMVSLEWRFLEGVFFFVGGLLLERNTTHFSMQLEPCHPKTEILVALDLDLDVFFLIHAWS